MPEPKLRAIGDRVTLRSGEWCELKRYEFTPKGLRIWHLAALTKEWAGLLFLTTHELDANAL